MIEATFGATCNLGDDRQEARADAAEYDRLRAARNAKPDPFCTCGRVVEWSMIGGAWWPFIPGTTIQHTCKR